MEDQSAQWALVRSLVSKPHRSLQLFRLALLSSAYSCICAQPAWADSWQPAGSRSAPGTGHTATLLTNGQVLVTGGFYGAYPGTYFTNTDLYVPASGAWKLATPMSVGRSGHSATVLTNGAVLIAGGVSDHYAVASAELYDVATDTWRLSGSMLSIRVGHTATLLPNGKVLITGGQTWALGPLASAETYDPVSETWSGAGTMSTARFYHTATLLPNGKVLVAGGYDTATTYATAELYDPSDGSWVLTGTMNSTRRSHTATLLPNGMVLVAGGSTGSGVYPVATELYDPLTGTWSPTGALVQGRANATATLLANGKVLIVGGDCTGSTILASAELYDPASGTWKSTAPLSTTRHWDRAVRLPNTGVLVVGGSGGGGDFSSAELFTYSLTTPIALTGALRLPTGAFQFTFSNAPGATFTALATTDLALPLTNWTAMGAVPEVSPGRFQFTDTRATNWPRCSYRVCYP
jgi:hypothetical protein